MWPLDANWVCGSLKVLGVDAPSSRWIRQRLFACGAFWSDCDPERSDQNFTGELKLLESKRSGQIRDISNAGFFLSVRGPTPTPPPKTIKEKSYNGHSCIDTPVKSIVKLHLWLMDPTSRPLVAFSQQPQPPLEVVGVLRFPESRLWVVGSASSQFISQDNMWFSSQRGFFKHLRPSETQRQLQLQGGSLKATLTRVDMSPGTRKVALAVNPVLQIPAPKH